MSSGHGNASLHNTKPRHEDRAETNLQPMLVSIPLTEDEQAAVEDGQAGLDRLLQRLADVPTPAGPTPRQGDSLLTATQLPIVAVDHGSPAPTGSVAGKDQAHED